MEATETGGLANRGGASNNFQRLTALFSRFISLTNSIGSVWIFDQVVEVNRDGRPGQVEIVLRPHEPVLSEVDDGSLYAHRALAGWRRRTGRSRDPRRRMTA